ncbi:MAG TPA: hypothetical protein PK957_02320 [Candidatus Dojkabacteria bacterium]|nr:hypothetical protein [Candidatus Dojkabacteria bacterium]HQF36390.1 hypothetical protein [Candidatus Dojkabacteria bacterium]
MKRNKKIKRNNIFLQIKNKLTLKKISKSVKDPLVIQKYKQRSNETFIFSQKRKIALLFQAFRHNIKVIWIIGAFTVISIIFAQHMNFFSYVFKSSPKSTESVYGLSLELPAYPNSSFAFPHYKNSKEVEQLKNYDMSCYTLPVGHDFDKAIEFYKSELGKRGWKFIGESTISDTTKEPGIYFISENENIGIRIYSVASDIWYEIISVDEANQMLADRMTQKQKLIYTIQSLHGEELPDKYKFSLSYSYEYRIQNKKSKDFPSDGFSIEKNDNKILVIPYRWRAAITPEDALDEYVSILLENNFAGSDTIRLFPSSPTEHNEIEFIIQLIMVDDKSFRVACLVEPTEKIIYIIDGSESNDILFDYLIENIKLR